MAFYTLEELELNIADQINKLVQNGYHIDGETIYIVDVWDTRREPKKLVKGL